VSGGDGICSAFTAMFDEVPYTPSLVGIREHGGVVDAAIGGRLEAALVLMADGTVYGCGRERRRDGSRPRGRLPGAVIPELWKDAVFPTELAQLHRTAEQP
jgi:hypothetical protein